MHYDQETKFPGVKIYVYTFINLILEVLHHFSRLMSFGLCIS